MRGNPVYRRERKVSSRSIRLPLIMLTFNGILAFVALLNMYSMSAQAQVTAEIQYSGFLELYVFVALIEFLMLFFIMPALTAGSISGERERKTLDLMLVTQMTPGEIVFGKLFSSMQSMVLLVISSFPVFFLVFVYGGIQIKDLGLLFLLYLVVALLSASFGRPLQTFRHSYGHVLWVFRPAIGRNLCGQCPYLVDGSDGGGQICQPGGVHGLPGEFRGLLLSAAAEPCLNVLPGDQRPGRQPGGLVPAFEMVWEPSA